MSVIITGIISVGGDEDRVLADLQVEHNGKTYNWQRYIPVGMGIQTFQTSYEVKIKAEIDAREKEWAALEPKTKQTLDPLTGQLIEVPIEKHEIVKPEIPDYYAKRRAEYPSAGEQLGALLKGGQYFDNLQITVANIKNKYPKPDWS